MPLFFARLQPCARIRFGIVTASLLLPAFASIVAENTKQDPASAALLEKAREGERLTDPASAPSYHLTASFETSTYRGDPEGKGTLDLLVMHDGPWVMKTTFRGETSTNYFASGDSRSATSDGYRETFAQER